MAAGCIPSATMPKRTLLWGSEMVSMVGGIAREMVSGQQTTFGPGLHDESSSCPILQRTGFFDGLHYSMLWWNENVVESVQKCENMGCVVWSKVGMTVEDTMHIGDGSAHCDVPTTVGLMWDCINIHFQYSLKTKNRNQSKWCYSIQYTGKQCCLYTYILLPILYLDPHLLL